MIKYFNNRQINLNVNVNNYNTVQEDVISKLYSISGNVQTLNSNIENITNGNYFDEKFEEKFSVDDYEKLLNIIQNNNAITGYINAYDDFNSFIGTFKNVNNTLMNYKFNECEVLFPSNQSDEEKYAIVINGEISGSAINIKDTDDEDFDSDTIYKFDIPGFVLRIEVYTNTTSKFTEVFFTKLSYNSNKKCTTVYLSSEDYTYIRNLEPNNKLKIVYLSKI